MQSKIARSLTRLYRRFSQAKTGNVAMMFALFMVPLIASTGLAVDLARVYRIRAVTQAAVDTAALAAGRAAQTNSATPLTSATNAATQYFNTAKPSAVLSSTMAIAADSTFTNFTLTSTTWLSTPFLSILSMIDSRGAETGAPAACTSKYACLKLTNTATASIAAGGNGGSNVEVSLMLDVTGSMQGSKLATLKDAATDLVDTIIWSDQSQYTSRMAIVPFAPAVNVGETYFQAVTNDTTTQTIVTGGRRRRSRSTTTITIDPCVVDRTGTYAYTDDAPGSGKWIPTYWDAMDEATCDPSASIVPLTSDKTTLKNLITSLQANGGTAGPLGTAWAWYMISPNWASIWGTSSAPGSYAALTTLNSRGAPTLKKFAVLMTDGDYNIMGGDNASQSDANTAAETICTNMKARGIEVYTVGFELSSTAARTVLTNCATDSSHFYDASSESALVAAFRDIALKISSLRLTN